MASHAPVMASSGGLFDSLGGIGTTLGEMLRVRGSLLAVELKEEIERRKQMLVLALIGAALLHAAFLLLTLLVLAAFWDTYRLAAIGSAAAIYFACGLAALARLRASIAMHPAPFAASRGELAKDLAALGARPGS